MTSRPSVAKQLAAIVLLFVVGPVTDTNAGDASAMPASETASAPSMPPIPDMASMPGSPSSPSTSEQPQSQSLPINVYSQTRAGYLRWSLASDLPRVYVPNHSANTVSVIDPLTLRVVDTIKVGVRPQHVVPSWDLTTLWVANNGRGRRRGSLTPIDPKTGRAGPAVPVQDPYNVYFLPDGSAAVVVDEALKQLDLRDPKTMALTRSISTPMCRGINHADFSADGSYAIFTCEFSGRLLKINLWTGEVLGTLDLVKMSMPQDIRLSPDGKVFYVADMMDDGVHVIDGDNLTEIGFIPTGPGAHGLTVSRDGTKLYVSNRGNHRMSGAAKHGPGSVSVIDFATSTVVAQWPIPGGGSPDMGNVSADGKQLWLSGRFDNEVYVFDTASGAVTKIQVGREPHGLTVWPQPGRYSLGHTGNMR